MRNLPWRTRYRSAYPGKISTEGGRGFPTKPATFNRSARRSRWGSMASMVAATDTLRNTLYAATTSQTADKRFKRHIFFIVMKPKGVKIGRLVRERPPNCLVDYLRDRCTRLRRSQPERLMDIGRKIDR